MFSLDDGGIALSIYFLTGPLFVTIVVTLGGLPGEVGRSLGIGTPEIGVG